MADVARLSSAHITRLPPRVAFYLQASIIVAFLAASSAPTPLYAVYQARWGFTPITIATVFGIYALAVLAALLTIGSLSDYVGRRPVLLFAIVLQAGGLVVLAQANGLLELVVGRILQGLATGAACRCRGSRHARSRSGQGYACECHRAGDWHSNWGAALRPPCRVPAGPTRLVYLVLLAIVVVQGVGVVLMAETVVRRPGALASLPPHFDLRRPTRRPLLVVGPALFAAWALAGVGFASGFQGAIRSVLPLASAQHRAGTEPCVAIADVLFREPRFTMLETIREYGLEQLESRGLPPHSDSSPGAAMR